MRRPFRQQNFPLPYFPDCQFGRFGNILIIESIRADGDGQNPKGFPRPGTHLIESET
jgi:hypothetical protein